MCLRERNEGIAKVESRLKVGVFMGDTSGEMHKVVLIDGLFIGSEGGILYRVGDGVEGQGVFDGVGGDGVVAGVKEGVGGSVVEQITLVPELESMGEGSPVSVFAAFGLLSRLDVQILLEHQVVGENARVGVVKVHVISRQQFGGVVVKILTVEQSPVLLHVEKVDDIAKTEAIHFVAGMKMPKEISHKISGVLVAEVTLVAVPAQVEHHVEEVADVLRMGGVKGVLGLKAVSICQLGIGSFQLIIFQITLILEIKRVRRREKRKSRFFVKGEIHRFVRLSVDAQRLINVLIPQ